MQKNGFFYNLLQNSGHIVKGWKCHGKRLSNMRLTVLLCSNDDDSKKIGPLVIGKSKNPLCFKHIQSFPTKYTHFKTSWMTGSLFENHLYDLDRAMEHGTSKKKNSSFRRSVHLTYRSQSTSKKCLLWIFPPKLHEPAITAGSW